MFKCYVFLWCVTSRCLKDVARMCWVGLAQLFNIISCVKEGVITCHTYYNMFLMVGDYDPDTTLEELC